LAAFAHAPAGDPASGAVVVDAFAGAASVAYPEPPSIADVAARPSEDPTPQPKPW
jgi:hypothetical protein